MGRYCPTRWRRQEGASAGHLGRGRGHLGVRPRHPVVRRRHPVVRRRHPVVRRHHPVVRRRHSVARPRHPVARSRHPVARPGHSVASPRHPVTRSRHPVARPGHSVARPCHPLIRQRHPTSRWDEPTTRRRLLHAARCPAGMARSSSVDVEGPWTMDRRKTVHNAAVTYAARYIRRLYSTQMQLPGETTPQRGLDGVIARRCLFWCTCWVKPCGTVGLHAEAGRWVREREATVRRP
ncbi:uncharacterized protein CMC5_016100 [Chondromyces crocatus]|uniref:Uncharacterized protein n=1 Tax=Chondromyces crocatus TaxID=52 RepID=A0A0K1E9E3_CHOCO|nr:uncharacterized protein CMC5_016100 [Chondromyces crocatus]